MSEADILEYHSLLLFMVAHFSYTCSDSHNYQSDISMDISWQLHSVDIYPMFRVRAE
jgi:hypothetical protein